MIHCLVFISNRLVNMMPMLWYNAVPRVQCSCLCMVVCIIMLFSECFGVKYTIKNSGYFIHSRLWKSKTEMCVYIIIMIYYNKP